MIVAERRSGTPAATEAASAAAATLRDRMVRAPAARLVRAAVEAPPLDPVTLFAAAASMGEEAILWQAADGPTTTVAIGAAWSIEADGTDRAATIGSAWRTLVGAASDAGEAGTGGPRLYGALGFDAAPAATATWSGFERARFMLPAITLEQGSGPSTLVLTHVRDDDQEAADTAADALSTRWRRLLGSLARPATEAAERQLRIVSTTPGYEAWEASVARIAGAVGRGRLDKAVLTRAVELEADGPLDVAAVLTRLRAAAAGTTVFAFARGTRVFLGATPERLVRVSAGDLTTMAMAGSTPRGSTPSEDAELARRLLESDKEREEHAVVVEMLRRTLAPLTATLDVPPAPHVERFGRIQHLVTPISGRIGPDHDVLDLVGRLHPTPAVGGTPTDLALELIADEERHERGWYAGPVGWVDAAGDGDSWVALRSGVIDGSTATLLAGCGIVADSDPAREWQESLVKLRALGAALGRVER